MSAAAKSLLYFGVYRFGNAATLLLAPNLFLSLFGLPPTQEPWIRVLGLVVGVLGSYYPFMARHGITAMYQATVDGRNAAAAVFVMLVLAGLGWSWPVLAGLGRSGPDAAAVLWRGGLAGCGLDLPCDAGQRLGADARRRRFS